MLRITTLQGAKKLSYFRADQKAKTSEIRSRALFFFVKILFFSNAHSLATKLRLHRELSKSAQHNQELFNG